MLAVILIFVLLIFLIVLGILIVQVGPFLRDFISNKIIKNKYRSLGKSSQERLLYELRDAVEYLSKNKIGALITLENNENLDNLRTDGVILNANLSSSLLIAIFSKESPIHDGAVIIRDNKIYYASTFYKITRKSVDNSLGSRHRAALGISEQSDATTVVVSEETGTITILKGTSMTKVPLADFRETLLKYIKD
ncbi:diadenylate cyclase [Mycoplasmopsis columboralis]|uniref:Membrane protein n=1 Tax=Mycoplasmopsis columboralis TaxID=171282 RepID=A0A449B6E3_9BACT|nr:DNA integrity scanning protein DisA nucleotide-binding domain protein [Mycoplasmopsis columboralis]VEU76177.1 membrane protein [Mycoplasmopsis columboralis]